MQLFLKSQVERVELLVGDAVEEDRNSTGGQKGAVPLFRSLTAHNPLELLDLYKIASDVEG